MIPPALHRRLKAAVEALGGPVATAQRLGVSEECVRWWQRGRSAPREAMAQKLADMVPGAVAENFRR